MEYLLIASAISIVEARVNTINRVFTTQIGFVAIAEATPAVIAAAIRLIYSGRPTISVNSMI